MIICDNPLDLGTTLSSLYCTDSSIGFVPTMGALHQGHASLIERSVRENTHTVVSIFVNPTQFGPGEDLDKYPRTLQADLDLCASLGATHAFTPTTDKMYPEGRDNFEIQFGLRSLDKILCGAKRPGHFDGVLQVVSKLFNLVRPHRAYFGKKDFQQLTILKKLGAELFFPIEIIGCEIVREADGLAMSSRNRYLNTEERQQALFLSHCLNSCRQMAKNGLPVAELEKFVENELTKFSLIRLDYFDVRSSHDLRSLEILDEKDAPRGIMAAFCGNTRLIDNLPLM